MHLTPKTSILCYGVKKMRKLIIVFMAVLFLTACTAEAEAFQETSHAPEKEHHAFFSVSRVEFKSDAESDVGLEEESKASESMKAIWVSQFDMKPLYRNGTKQREEADYRSRVEAMTANLARDGFNTVFLQVRPNGDSMYESEFYPLSRYVAGSYGGSISYDAIEIYLEIAKKNGISVHAWINPFRLCEEGELKNAFGRLKEWSADIGGRIKLGSNGVYYLDPSYEEATELIVDGATEILEKYDFDGIHIDDYFYPTEFELDDEAEFKSSGYTDKGEFRRDNVSRTVKALYDAVHGFEGKVFGISPAGNITSLPKKWYADIYVWLENDGYTDYILPQLYFGFENAVCPFERTLEKWEAAVKNENITLYIGLSAAKCAIGSKGGEDKYAGEAGKYEWRDNKDILVRSLEAINSSSADGVCIFTYSSFYSTTTGERNSLTLEEATSFIELLKKSE